MKNFNRILIILITALFISVQVFAHSGRTDSSGGHRDTSTGSYHYHHGYSAHSHKGGKCPYNSDSSSTETKTWKLPTVEEVSKIKPIGTVTYELKYLQTQEAFDELSKLYEISQDKYTALLSEHSNLEAEAEYLAERNTTLKADLIVVSVLAGGFALTSLILLITRQPKNKK